MQRFLKIQFYLILLFQLPVILLQAQDMLYFHKIADLAKSSANATVLFKKLDSLKKTRRPTDSGISIYFNRNIDFGYKHERIDVVLNSFRYKVNLLTKNDSIYLSSVKFDETIYGNDYSKSLNSVKIDTAEAVNYLRLRNTYYGSSKTIKDLIYELNIDEVYAFYCGDGSPKTKMGKHIEELAKNRNVKQLRMFLQSINCELQAYGEAGFEILKKNGTKPAAEIEKIVVHLKNRNTTLVECNGCFQTVGLSNIVN